MVIFETIFSTVQKCVEIKLLLLLFKREAQEAMESFAGTIKSILYSTAIPQKEEEEVSIAFG